MTGRCAFWIASSNYLDEAYNSFVQFKKVMPDIETHLVYIGNVTDIDNYVLPSMRFWFDVHTIKKPEHDLWYLNSTMAMNIAVQELRHYNMIYFDTDTYLVEPVYEIFEMLEHGFDFIAAHAPGRHTAPTVKPIPDAFPEFNVGVCGFSDLAKKQLIREWYRQYSQYQDIYGNNDQPSLREVLWNYRYRIGTLPPEYNFRFNFGGFLRYPVKVLHGRNPDMARVANSVNEKKGMRLWKIDDMEECTSQPLSIKNAEI